MDIRRFVLVDDGVVEPPVRRFGRRGVAPGRICWLAQLADPKVPHRCVLPSQRASRQGGSAVTPETYVLARDAVFAFEYLGLSARVRMVGGRCAT